MHAFTPQGLILVTGGYLLGSLSAAILLTRLCGMQDPRQYGSGNPGATNVLRSGNKKIAALVLLGDMLKGLIAVLIARWTTTDGLLIVLAGFAAFLGHLYPIFFHFKGGKGVATALGVLLGISWPLGLMTLATWLVTLKITRISSTSALAASALAPVYAWWLVDPGMFAVLLLMCVLLIWRHKANIQRLIQGKEH
ncbi:MAG: glycerol-3-phosphate 1-O-acyltransferase [Gammaproteobacteria bacterium]|nr:MAG: glycerol-3-phosphate 1-O-acyltransferase [Gammaproteobacteria bacterium]